MMVHWSARFVVYSLSLVGWIVSVSTSDGGVRNRSIASFAQALQVSRYHRHRHDPRTSRLVSRPTVLVLRGGGGGGGWTRQRKGLPRSGLDPVQALPQNKQQAVTVIAQTASNKNDNDAGAERRRSIVMIRRTSILAAMVAVAVVAVYYRTSWSPYFNKQAIQDTTLSLLRQLRNGEDAATTAASIPAMLYYAMGLMVWEAAGLSTIPVETAAGMVFRFHEAALASIGGKVMGATLAFLVGRTFLSSSLDQFKPITRRRLFVMLRSRNTHPPLLTAALMKFSILPELLKNLGSAVLPQIKLWMFVLVTLCHGGGFSLMWTWLGTSMRLNETSPALRATLIIGAFIGGVLTPLTMAWWVTALQAMSSSGNNNQENEQVNRNKLDTNPVPNSSSSIKGQVGRVVTSIRRRIDAYLVRPMSLVEMWIGGLCVASITALVVARNVV
jgi:uncharacterized membrane protein YdjX (TVP38/TMEM64 family)